MKDFPDLGVARLAVVEEAYSSGLLTAVAQSNTILFSDIDNTFICHEGHTYPLTDDSHLLASTLAARSFGAVLITGAVWSRENHSGAGTGGVLQRIAADGNEKSIIPANVHVIFSSGGLEGHVRNTKGDFIPDVVYQNFIEAKKQAFDQELVEATAAQFINQVNKDFSDLDISPMTDVEITFVPVSQVAVFQHLVKEGDGRREGKISVYVHAESEGQLQQLSKLASEYADRCGAQCVICEEKDINNRLNTLHHGNPPVKRYNIDFTAITKSTPIDYIAARCDTGSAATVQCVVAGDAGNDSAMFLAKATTHGIIVGGAAKELQDQAAVFSEQGVVVYNEAAHTIGPNSILLALEQFFPSGPFGSTGMPHSGAF